MFLSYTLITDGKIGRVVNAYGDYGQSSAARLLEALRSIKGSEVRQGDVIPIHGPCVVRVDRIGSEDQSDI